MFLNLPTNLFIGGAWRESSDRRRFDVIDPATEQVLSSVADGTVADAVSAVDAAAAALPAWAARAPRERAEILRKAFEVLIGQKERIARLITLENGKALPDSRSEAAYAAEFFRWYAEEAVRNIGQLSRAPSSGARILVQHKPAGVAVLVTPWNFPAAMGTRKIAPALAAGCTVVLKPASETPLTMLLLAELLAEAGVPPGVVNILPARSSGAVVGRQRARGWRCGRTARQCVVARQGRKPGRGCSRPRRASRARRTPDCGARLFLRADRARGRARRGCLSRRGDLRAGRAAAVVPDEDDAIARANDTEYGLVAYVYTRDLARGLKVTEKLEFGMVGLNRGLVSDPAAPFGGVKQSGLGREGAHEGLMEFLETQYVSVAW